MCAAAASGRGTKESRTRAVEQGIVALARSIKGSRFSRRLHRCEVKGDSFKRLDASACAACVQALFYHGTCMLLARSNVHAPTVSLDRVSKSALEAGSRNRVSTYFLSPPPHRSKPFRARSCRLSEPRAHAPRFVRPPVASPLPPPRSGQRAARPPARASETPDLGTAIGRRSVASRRAWGFRARVPQRVMGSAEDAAAQRRARAEARKRRLLAGGTDRLAAVSRLRAEIEQEGACR